MQPCVARCGGAPGSAGRAPALLGALSLLLAAAEGRGAALLRGRRRQSSNVTSEVGSNFSTAMNTSLQQDTSRPRVYFLFLANTKVSNLGVWLRFFNSAPRDSYRALVHCKEEECKIPLRGTTLEVVPTVPSYYCTDLVSPMNQLLERALESEEAGSPRDKFVFVSDSTLPAKPFSEVHRTLTGRPGSDFCVFPTREWADVRSAGSRFIAPKHHQWVTLEREHAEKSLSAWTSGKHHDLMSWYRMNQAYWSPYGNRAFDGRNFGCLDEFWHLMAVYGPITQRVGSEIEGMQVSLPNFFGDRLQVSADAGWQGQCDTFVMWQQYLDTPVGLSGRTSPFEKLHQSLDQASIPHGGNSQRPGWWDTISPSGIASIRRSAFLFVRKFTDNPTLAGGGDFGSTYERIVLK